MIDRNELVKAERQAKTAALYAEGLSAAAIAERLSLSVSTVYRDLRDLLEGWAADHAELVNFYAEEQLRRTEELYMALLPGIQRGSPRAIEVALKVLERQAKLLGLDAPAESRINQISRVEVEYIDIPLEAVLPSEL